jgi:tetratricopeptide (TPR) repeat protein
MRKLAVMVLAGSTFLMAQDPVDFDGWLKQGLRQFRQAQYPEAAASFERAIALDYSNPIAHLYLGAVYATEYIPGGESEISQSVGRRAVDEFQRVLALEPSNKLALCSIAWLKLTQAMWDDALGWYGKLIEVDASNADAHYSIGFILWRKWYPNWAAARANAGLAPETPGRIPDATIRASLSKQYGPMIQSGIDALRKAIEIDPEHTDAMTYLSLLIRERADLRDSAAEYQQDLAIAGQWAQKASDVSEQREMFAHLVPPPPPPR